MSETLIRQWQMLRLLPRMPKMLSTPDIHSALLAAGFSVTARTVQRDLENLQSQWLSLESDTDGRAHLWAWSRDALPLDTPRLSTSEALTFLMTEEHLRDLMPASTLAQMKHYFELARQRLGLVLPRFGAANAAERATSVESNWRAKVRVLPSNQPLLMPAVNNEALAVVQEALLRDVQCELTYLKRDASSPDVYPIHPLGLVQRGLLLYLVCTIKSYADIKLLAVHRIQAAKQLTHAAKTPAGFSLDAYIASGALGWSSASEAIVLKLRMTADVAVHLRETALSDDQIVEQASDVSNDWILVTASVQLTQQLVWWLRGFGDAVEVLEPLALRSQMRETAQRMATHYGSSSGTH